MTIYAARTSANSFAHLVYDLLEVHCDLCTLQVPVVCGVVDELRHLVEAQLQVHGNKWGPQRLKLVTGTKEMGLDPQSDWTAQVNCTWLNACHCNGSKKAAPACSATI